MYLVVIKPFFDRLVSLTLLVALSPVFLLIMILLAIFQHGHVFFIQERPGYHERLFNMVKFKSMSDQVDALGNLLPADQRLTAIGKVLRQTSLDELPQLFNVVLGDMSIVGPRPLLTEYLPLFSVEQHKRHDVRPGITGWTQVNGRTEIPWSRKLELDIFYARHVSFWLDMRILLETIVVVLSFRRVSLTEKPFQGN